MPSELETWLGVPDDSEERRLLTEIRSLTSRAIEGGVSPELTQPRQSLFTKILDVLDTPKQFVLGSLAGVFKNEYGTGNPLLNAGTGALEGMQSDINFFDILRDPAVGLQDYPVARGLLGFTGEVLADPLSYLGIGAISRAGKLTTAGGQVLSKAGQAWIDTKRADLFGKGMDVLDADRYLDQSFQALGSYRKLERELQAAEKTHQTAKARDIRFRLSQEREIAERAGLQPWEDAYTLLEQPKIYADMAIPFLGDLTAAGRAKNVARGAELDEIEAAIKAGSAGASGKSVRNKANLIRARLGRVFNPLDVKIAEVELPEKFVKGYYTLKEQAAQSIERVLGELNTEIDAAQVFYPVGGKVLKLAADSAKQGAHLASWMADSFKNIFARKMAIGRHYYNVRDYELAHATADQTALDMVREFDPTFNKMEKAGRAGETYGPEFQEATRIRKQATLAIDSSLKKLLERFTEADEGGAILAAIDNYRLGKSLDDESLLWLDQLIPEFKEQVRKTILDDGFGPEVATYAQRLMDKFDELAVADSKFGIRSGFLSFYVPHRYKLETGKKGSGTIQFTKERRFDTLQQALDELGMLPELDAATLLHGRARESLIKRAQARLFQRMVVLDALPESRVAILAQEALEEGPDSDAYKILVGRGYKPRMIETMPGFSKFETPPEQATLLPNAGLQKWLGERKELQAKVIEELTNFDADAELVALASGAAPSSFKSAAPLFEEFNRAYRVGGQEYIVPDVLRRMHDEYTVSKDLMKRYVGNHPKAKGILDFYDNATKVFKNGMTVLFPSYWNINLTGDRIFGLIQDITNFDPGLAGETYAVLNGAMGVKVGNTGKIIPPDVYRRIAKASGITVDPKDILEFQDTFARLEPETFMRRYKSEWGNLEEGHAMEAFKGAQTKMANLFENFYRHQVFINHLKKGNPIPDAMRLTNQALIDYRDLSPVEASLFRRFFMFYGWLSNSTKKTLTSLLFSPGDIQKQVKGARGLAEFFSGQGAVPTPESREMDQLKSLVSQEQVSFYLGKDKEGKTLIGRAGFLPANTVLQQFGLFAPRNLTLGELADTFYDSGTRTLQKQFATANPFIKAGAEALAQKNLYFDKPLSAKFLRTVPALAAGAEKIAGYPYNRIPLQMVDEAMKAFLRARPDGEGNLIADPGRMWLVTNFIPGLSRALSTYKNVMDEKVDPAARVMRLISGLRYDKQNAERMQLYEQRDTLRELIEEKSVPKRI